MLSNTVTCPRAKCVLCPTGNSMSSFPDHCPLCLCLFNKNLRGINLEVWSKYTTIKRRPGKTRFHLPASFCPRDPFIGLSQENEPHSSYPGRIPNLYIQLEPSSRPNAHHTVLISSLESKPGSDFPTPSHQWLITVPLKIA